MNKNEQLSGSTLPVWSVIWRLLLLVGAVAFWLLPDAWTRSARNLGPALLVVFPVVNIGAWIAPLAGGIDAIFLFVGHLRKTERYDGLFACRAVWITLMLIHTAAIVLDAYR